MVSCGLHGFRNVQAHPGLAHANEQGALALIDQLLSKVSTEQRCESWYRRFFSGKAQLLAGLRRDVPLY
jgi:hypothetical protein